MADEVNVAQAQAWSQGQVRTLAQTLLKAADVLAAAETVTQRTAADQDRAQEAEAKANAAESRLATIEASERSAMAEHEDRRRSRAILEAQDEKAHQDRVTARTQEVEELEARARKAEATVDELRSRFAS